MEGKHSPAQHQQFHSCNGSKIQKRLVECANYDRMTWANNGASFCARNPGIVTGAGNALAGTFFSLNGFIPDYCPRHGIQADLLFGSRSAISNLIASGVWEAESTVHTPHLRNPAPHIWLAVELFPLPMVLLLSLAPRLVVIQSLFGML
jgi:hypothetical protein